MSQPIPDLWPNSISTSEIRSPVSILREQAALLGKKTQNLVIASVRTTAVSRRATDSQPEDEVPMPWELVEPMEEAQSQGGFVHSFRLITPALQNYTYTLFRVEHGIEFYPAEFQGPGRMRKRAGAEEDFVEILGRILSSETTRHTIASLIAQVETA